MKLRAFIILILIFLPETVCSSSIESKIKSLNEKARTVESQRLKEEKILKNINFKIGSIQKQINTLRSAIDKRKVKIRETSEAILRFDEELRRNESEMTLKIVDLYKAHTFDSFDSLSGNRNFAPYAVVSIKANIEQTKNFIRLKELKEKARISLENENAGLQKDILDMNRHISNLDSEKKKKAELLSKLKKESQAYKNQIDKLLKQLKAKQKKDVIPGTGLAKFKGSLPWPVNGKVIKGFGKRNESGILQLSQGIDIDAAPKTRVKCIYKGKAVYFGWLDILGNTLIIDHGGGFHSVYGYLDKSLVKVGQEVAAGDFIASTGYTHTGLHFEIRYNGMPLDPLQWLSRR